MRRFELAGAGWTVREVLPASTGAAQPATLLVFDSGVEQRQLNPAPAGWLLWDDTRLQDACLRATNWGHPGVDRARGTAP